MAMAYLLIPIIITIMPQNEKNYSVNTFSQTYADRGECWFSLCGPTISMTTVGHSFRRQNLSMVFLVVVSLSSSFWKVKTHFVSDLFFLEIFSKKS